MSRSRPLFEPLIGQDERQRERERRVGPPIMTFSCCAALILFLLVFSAVTVGIILLALNGGPAILITTTTTTTTAPTTTTTTTVPTTTTTTTTTTTVPTTTTTTTTAAPTTTAGPTCFCADPVMVSSFDFPENSGRCLAYNTQDDLMYLFVGFGDGLHTMAQSNLTSPYVWGSNLLTGGNYPLDHDEVSACAYDPDFGGFLLSADFGELYWLSSDGQNETIVLNDLPASDRLHGYAVVDNVMWGIVRNSGLLYSFSKLNVTTLSGPIQLKEYDALDMLQNVNGFDIRYESNSGLFYVIYNRYNLPNKYRTVGIVDVNTGIITKPCWSDSFVNGFSTLEFTPDGTLWIATGEGNGAGLNPRTLWRADGPPCAYMPTTTTTMATTTPSSFSLVCPDNYMGELEEQDLSNVPVGVMVSGMGCGGSNVTVTGPNVNSMFVSAKSIPHHFEKRSMGNTMMMDYQVVTSSSSILTSNIVGYTPEQYAIQFGISSLVNTATSPSKKDISTYDSQEIYASSIVGGISQTQFYEEDKELFFSGDGHTYYVGVGNVMPGSILFYTNNDGGSTLVPFNDIFPSSCGGASPLTPPSFTRYDWEAERYVIVVMSNLTAQLCVAVSNSSNPFEPWEVDTWDDSRFTHSRGLGFSIWGDYYNLCWIDQGDNQQCVIMERAKLLDNSAPAKIAFLDTPVFPVQSGYVIPPPYPMNQGYSVRGPLISTHAPCGMLSMLNDYTQSIDYMLCTGLDFSSPNPNGTIAFTVLHTNVTGGWTSAHANATCDGNLGSNGCITTSTAYKKPAFANYIRTAYHSFSGYERVAYTFVSEVLVKAKVLWGEMTGTELLAETPTTPGAPVIATISMTTRPTFASNLIYDCRETLHLVAYASGGTFLRLFSTYKLRTDPAGALRLPAAPTTDASSISNSNWGMATLSQSAFKPRIFHGIWLDEGGWLARNVGLKTQNITLEYVGEDDCMHQETCTQLAIFGTVASCSNTVVGF